VHFRASVAHASAKAHDRVAVRFPFINLEKAVCAVAGDKSATER
jgi:hypothetical protein